MADSSDRPRRLQRDRFLGAIALVVAIPLIIFQPSYAWWIVGMFYTFAFGMLVERQIGVWTAGDSKGLNARSKPRSG